MEHFIAKILEQLANYGPGALVGIVFAFLYFGERKRGQEASDKLYELGTASVKSESEHARILESTLRVLESIDRRIK